MKDPKDSRTGLHQLLLDRELYSKSYDEFEKQFSNDSSRAKLYDLLVESNLYSKSVDDFNAQFFSDLVKKKSTPLGPGVVGPPESSILSPEDLVPSQENVATQQPPSTPELTISTGPSLEATLNQAVPTMGPPAAGQIVPPGAMPEQSKEERFFSGTSDDIESRLRAEQQDRSVPEATFQTDQKKMAFDRPGQLNVIPSREQIADNQFEAKKSHLKDLIAKSDKAELAQELKTVSGNMVKRIDSQLSEMPYEPSFNKSGWGITGGGSRKESPRDVMLMAKDILQKVSESGDHQGFFEGLTSNGAIGVLPFLSGLDEMPQLQRIYEASQKAHPTEPENALLNAETLRREYESAKESGSWYDAGKVLADMLPYMGEYALTSGTYSVAKSAATKGLTSVLRGAATKPAVVNSVVKPLSTLMGVAAQTSANPSRIINTTLERMTPQMQLAVNTESGELDRIVADKGEDFKEAFAKSFGVNALEILTERFGQWGNEAMKAMKMSDQWMPQVIFGRWMEKRGFVNMAKANEVFKQIGWDGVFQEIWFEEYPNKLLQELVTGDQGVVEDLMKKGPPSAKTIDFFNPLAKEFIDMIPATVGISALGLGVSALGKKTEPMSSDRAEQLSQALKGTKMGEMIEAQKEEPKPAPGKAPKVQKSQVPVSGDQMDEEKQLENFIHPIVQDLTNIETVFTNKGYSIDQDHDGETVVTNKKGDVVDPKDLPTDLQEAAGTYESWTKQLDEMAGSNPKLIAKVREHYRGKLVPAEEVKNELNSQNPDIREKTLDAIQKLFEKHKNDKLIEQYWAEAKGDPSKLDDRAYARISDKYFDELPEDVRHYLEFEAPAIDFETEEGGQQYYKGFGYGRGGAHQEGVHGSHITMLRYNLEADRYEEYLKSQNPEGKAGEEPKPDTHVQEKGRQKEVLGTSKAKIEKEPESISTPSSEPYVPKDGWDKNILKAREYAINLGIKTSGKDLPKLVEEINNKIQPTEGEQKRVKDLKWAYHAFGDSGVDLIAKQQEHEDVNVHRLLDQVQRILKVDQAGYRAGEQTRPFPIEMVAEALQYETSYKDNFKDLREAVQKGGFDNSRPSIERMLEVGVPVPKDILALDNGGMPKQFEGSSEGTILLGNPPQKYVAKFGPKKEFKTIGKNENFDLVGVDENGVRATMNKKGIVVSQPVGIIPGKGITVDSPSGEFLTTEETSKQPVKKDTGFFKEIDVTAGIKTKNPDWEKMSPEEYTKATSKPKLSEVQRDKLNKIKGELDDLLNSGLGISSDPKAEAERQVKITMKAAEFIGAYMELGVIRFHEIAKDIYEQHGEPALRALLDALKKGYGSVLASREDIEGLDDIKAVRAYKVEDIIKSTEDDRNTTVPDNTGGNAPQVPGGKETEETGGPVSEGETGRLPESGSRPGGRQSGRSEKTGSKRGRGTGDSERTTSVPTGSGESESASSGSPEENKGQSPDAINHHIENDDVIVPGGEIAKIKANIAAIKLVKKLQEESRNATPEEKKVLAKFVGWGGLAPVLDENKAYQGWDDNWEKKYRDYHNQIKELLTKDEFRTAVNSTINAHYTDRRVINGIWDLVRKLGFEGGKVLEPSAGIGHFFGLMPKDMAEQSSLGAYELDKLTGQILEKLYPQANVRIKGYEEATESPGSQDLVISNVPFGKDAPFDEKNKDLSQFSLHNYFIAKGIRQLKPGGIGVFITSMSSLDNLGSSTKFREWTNSEGNADFIGAIRLPNNAFSENAGTQVTTDILVYKKRTSENASDVNQQYRNIVPIGKTKNSEGNLVDISVNEYYANNPDMMLGTMKLAHEAGSGGLYSADVQTLQANPGQDTEVLLKEAVNRFPENIFGAQASAQGKTELAGEKDREGSLVEKNGKAFIVDNGELVPISDESITGVDKKKYTKGQIIKDYNEIGNAISSLLKAEQSDAENIDDLRKTLNTAYDRFVKKYGDLNRNPRVSFLEDDVNHSQVFALEDIKKTVVLSDTGRAIKKFTIGKSDIFNKRVNFPIVEPDKAENVQDAVNISLSYRNKVDLPYVASMMGMSEEEAQREILDSGLGFKNPSTGLIEDADTYLSGFVRNKLRDAENAGPEYEKNVEELKKVIPKDIPPQLVEFRLGSTWIPGRMIQDFAENVFGVEALIRYQPVTGNWLVDIQNGSRNEKNTITYALGDDFTAMDLLEKGLNLRAPDVFVTHRNPDGSKSTSKDQKRSAAAEEKLNEITDLFYNYIKNKPDFMQELAQIWNETRNGYTEKVYSLPVFKHFPGANEDIKLREHQMKAVMRALRDSVLLAHQVGTGKTFTMVTAAMEMRRLGIARKPMIVVQNSTLEQFAKNFKKLYPAAKILAPSKNEMDGPRRQALLNKIAYSDWDAIILPQSFYDRIPDDENRVTGYLMEQLDELKSVQRDAEGEGDRSSITDIKQAIKQVEKQLEKIEEGKVKTKKTKDTARENLKIEKLVRKQAARAKDDVLKFEDMGVDALFVDEAHEYKKLGFLTKMGRVKGIDTGRSQKALGNFMKIRWIQEKNKNKNVVLATGTPITNTMAEVWTMMKLLAPEVVKEYHIENFDEFATSFGSVEPSLEFTSTGKFKNVNRFKRYINAPELLSAFRNKTDVVLTEEVPEFKDSGTIPKLKTQSDGKPGFTQVTMKQTQGLKDVIKGFKDTLEAWEKLPGKQKRAMSYIPILIFTRAKQAAIDLRLLDPKAKDDPGSKTNNVVDQIKRIYDETSGYSGTQLVFSDMFQSPEVKDQFLDEEGTIPNPAFGQARFNLFQDMKRKLVERGVSPDEIAIIHDFEGEKRQPMFDKVKEGKIRILFGTTQGMGVGVDVQDKLAALHHMDAPPRPMDFEQRNGRILRQGNLHATMDKPVEILTYGVEKTLDATAYQRLAFKSKFINQMMKAEGVDRTMEDEADEDNTANMSFDQMMATLSGSQTAILHTAKMFELRKLKTAKSNYERNLIESSNQIRAKNNLIKALEDTYAKYLPVISEFKEAFPDNKITTVTVDDKSYSEKFTEALDPLVNDLILNPDKTKMIKVNGISVLLKSQRKMDMASVKYKTWIEYTLFSNKDKDVAISPKQATVSTAQGLVQSLNASINGFITEGYNGHTNILTIPERIEQNKKDIKALEESMNKPFDKEEKLKNVEAEVKELEEKMKTEEIPDEEPKRKNDLEGEQDFSGMASTGQGPTNPPYGTARKGRKGRIPVSPILGGESKPLREIVLDLSKIIESKIWYSKKPGRRKALGLYVPSSGSMVIKYSDDLDTIAHELGHHMDDKFDLLGTVTGTKMEKELKKLSKFGSNPPKGHPDPEAYKLNEGIAEYIRAWLVNPDAAEKQYPEFTLAFQATIPADVRSQLRSFGDDIRRYAGTPAIQQIQSKVKWEPDKAGGFWKKLIPNSSKANFELTLFDRFTKAWLNQLRPFEKAVEELIKKQGIQNFAKNKPADDPRILARLLFGSNNKVQDVLKNGFIDNENPVDKNGSINRRIDKYTNEPMSLEWLLGAYDNTDVASLDKDIKDAMAVAIARRTLELADKLKRDDYLIGVGAGIFTDTKVADKALQDFESWPSEQKSRIEEGIRRYKAYADASLDIAVESGRASQEWADAVRASNLEYVALGRIAEAGPGEELVSAHQGQGSKTLGAVSDLVKKIKGSTKTIQNPYKTLVENTIRVIKESDRNRVLLEFRNLLNNIRGMNDGDVAYVGSIGQKVGSGDSKNTQVIFVDGKREYWKLDADVYRFIKGLEEPYMLPGWFTALPRMLRWGVIHFPVFALRNRLRDIQQRLVVAKHGWSGVELNLKPGLRHSVKQAYEQFGGGQSGHWMLNEQSFNTMMEKTMNDLAKDKRNILVDPKRFFSEAGDLYNRVLQSGETATRLEEYRSAYREAIGKGMDPYNASVYAAFQARDLMDFAVAGEIMNVVNQMVPFSNAAVQGLRKTIRSAGKDPAGFAVRFILYSLLPSIMMRMLAHWADRDDEYANLPNYRRDLFYNIPVGDDLWLVIPKSFEIGVLGSAGDRLAGKFFYGEKNAFDGYAGSVARSIVPMDEAALAGPARSILEVTANYDFFREKHIVPPAEEGLDLELRDYSGASRLGKALSSAFGMDPRNWDHIVRSNIGYFGDFALRLSDVGEDDSRHKLIDWTTTGVFRHDPVYESKAVQDLMDRMERFGLKSVSAPRPIKRLMNVFNYELNSYFTSKDPTEKHEAGKRVRDTAEMISEFIDLAGVEEVQKIKHDVQMLKRGK